MDNSSQLNMSTISPITSPGKTATCPSPDLLCSCYLEMARKGIHFHDTLVKMPENSQKEISSTSMVPPSQPLPCPNKAMPLHTCTVIDETINKNFDKTTVAANPQNDRTADIVNRKKLSHDKNYYEEGTVQTGASHSEDSESSLSPRSFSDHCDTSINNGSSVPIQYEDALSVYDVYTLD